MSNEDRFRALLEAEPGNPAFADYAAMLVAQERLLDAIVVCLRGLSRNPELHRGRLLLAHALFRSGFTPFAAREVQLLCERMPTNQALRDLYSKLAPHAPLTAGVSEEEVAREEVGDVEFDVDLLEELDKKR
jgi:predicted Zn-dependent protease